ncbi:tyrosine-type recombinase/integrase [Bradyrhizobium liaoningense]|uniref:tyrosine-type recombinase/integrase n=1 Tax=Bradyrhizobium liaoningense TaxID=43992 RepID=UPI001FE2C22A|nr:integrase family protein [Bradyrhizobium liaoningense]
MTERWVRDLQPPPKPQQVEYFDDVAKGGVQGLILRHSHGGARTWACMYYEEGKSRTIKLGRYPVLTLAEARDAARKFLQDPQEAIEQRTPSDSFDKVVLDFIALNVKKRQLRSAKVIEQRIAKHLTPEFKGREFASIRRRDLSRLLDKIELENGAAMADAVLGIFRQIANWVESRDEDYRSPVGKKMRRSDSKPRDRVLSDDELRAFWWATGELGTFGALARTLLLLGQRRQKVALMKWTDLRGDVWHLATATREKANVGRIKLPRMVLDIIETQPRLNHNPYVFAGSRKSGAFNAFGQFAIALDRKMREKLPDMPEFTIHDLRRTNRTRLSRIGIDREVAERCLGHIVGNQIERTYARHDFFDEMTRAFQALADHVRDLVAPAPPNVVSLKGKKRAWNAR